VVPPFGEAFTGERWLLSAEPGVCLRKPFPGEFLEEIRLRVSPKLRDDPLKISTGKVCEVPPQPQGPIFLLGGKYPLRERL